MPTAAALHARFGPPIPVTSRLSGSACKVHFKGRDIPFDHCAQLNNYMQVYWTIHTYRVETIVYATRRKGWIAFGWGYSSMEGSNAVVAYKESYTQRAQIADYHLAYRGADGVRPEGFQDLTHQRATASTHHIAMMFARPLGRIDRGSVPALNESSKVPLIWAYGDSASFIGTLSGHSKTSRGWTYVDFGASKYTKGGGSNSYSNFGSGIETHANLMAFAWLLLIPLAIVAKMSKARPTLGYLIHRAANVAAMAVTSMGFFTAIVNGSHTYTAHMALGWGTVLLLVLQPVGLFWRSAKDELWRISHRSLGRVVLLIGLANCYIGLYIYQVSVLWFVLSTFVVAAFLAAGVACAFGLESRVLGEDEKTGLIDATDGTDSAPGIGASNHMSSMPASDEADALEEEMYNDYDNDNVVDDNVDDDDEVVVLANNNNDSNNQYDDGAPPRTFTDSESDHGF